MTYYILIIDITIYPKDLQLNKTYTFDTEALFLDLNSSIYNDITSTKIYDKLDDYDSDFPYFDCDVPRATSCRV